MQKLAALVLVASSLFAGTAVSQEYYIDGPRYFDERPRHYERERRYHRAERRRYCTPERALEIARREGLRGAKVGRTKSDQIEIKGRRGTSIVFGIAPSCPILGYND
jgi:hypothetical protein